MSDSTAINNAKRAAARHATSPLWGFFRSGMDSVELAHATDGSISRQNAARFLEAAAHRGIVIRRKEPGKGRGVVRYDYPDERPVERAVTMTTEMKPLRKAFPGPVIIPVREGGRVIPIMRDALLIEAVGR